MAASRTIKVFSAEPAVAADGAGMTVSQGMKSLRPAPLLNFVVRRRRAIMGLFDWLFGKRDTSVQAGSAAPRIHRPRKVALGKPQLPNRELKLVRNLEKRDFLKFHTYALATAWGCALERGWSGPQLNGFRFEAGKNDSGGELLYAVWDEKNQEDTHLTAEEAISLGDVFLAAIGPPPIFLGGMSPESMEDTMYREFILFCRQGQYYVSWKR